MSGRWRPRTLRVRLTAWHVAVMVVVLAIYVAAVLLIVTRNASRALDARLRSDFRWAAGMAQREADGSLSWFEGDPWSEETARGCRYGRPTAASSTGPPSPGGCRSRRARR